MRLTEKQQRVIKEAAQKAFCAEAEVYIFGSRTNDALFGGDIDIYIENVPVMTAEELLKKKVKMLVAIEKNLGEQKIDVVINQGKITSIIRSAKSTGIRI
jgi:predicted nucleotidyltransferase